MKCVIRAGIAFALAAMPATVSVAQQNPAPAQQAKPSDNAGHKKPQKAEVGAGTRDSTTTGTSGPKTSGGKGKPPLPDASLCQSYQGAVQQACLDTVLRKNAQAQPGAAQPSPSSAPPKANGASGNNHGG